MKPLTSAAWTSTSQSLALYPSPCPITPLLSLTLIRSLSVCSCDAYTSVICTPIHSVTNITIAYCMTHQILHLVEEKCAVIFLINETYSFLVDDKRGKHMDSCDDKAEFSTKVFIVTWSFKKHSNMLIWCSVNTDLVFRIKEPWTLNFYQYIYNWCSVTSPKQF